MKIFGYYSNDLDKTWYESSNIVYSECIDNDDSLKTLKVVFSNGTQYQYNDVNVNDYLLFREDASQGKALGKYIKTKGYEYVKLDDANLEELNGELEFRQKDGVFVDYKDGLLVLKDSVDKVILERKIELNANTFNVICDILNILGKELYIINGISGDGEGQEEQAVRDCPF